MQYIMFTKHLQGLDVSGIIEALQSVGVQGADLCVRPDYPVNPENAETDLPAAAKRFARAGLSIPLVTAPGDLTSPEPEVTERLYGACGQAGVRNIKLGYWHWAPGEDYWQKVEVIRRHLDGFERLSEKHGVRTCLHNHSGLCMGLNSCAAMDLVKGFDPRYVGVFADPGHLSIVGEPIEMALNIVKGHLAVVAFKDLVRQRFVQDGQTVWKTRVVRLGEGFGDFRTTLRALQRVGFDGPVSFHSEYSGQPVETVIDLARADVRFVNGLRAEEAC